MSSVMHAKNVVECLNVMIMNILKKKIGEEGSTDLPTNNDYLNKVLQKWDIKEMFSSSEVDFLGNVIAQFQKMSGNSVNYHCFLYNYFEKVPSECWPKKKEIMK